VREQRQLRHVTTWKFVPPNPKALTPACRAAGAGGHGRDSPTEKANGLRPGSQKGFGSFRWIVPGRTPVCRAQATLISPASPAAHLVCPSWDFTEPIVQLAGSAPFSVNTAVRVASSARSPTTVPVPCASIMPTSAGDTPALA
jgi:hypothetical protein